MQPIEFLGFAADCTITGKMTMFGERLTDFLNGQERYLVHHVECESLEDGHQAAIDSVSIERTDLLAVVATGPRGNEKQRVVAPDQPAAPLDRAVHGPRPAAHASPARDAVADVLKRDPMVPLTNATIAYEVAGAIVARDLPTIIVNRLLVEWISPTTEAASMFPDVPVRSPFAARLQKDFTGTPERLTGRGAQGVRVRRRDGRPLDGGPA